MADQDSKTKYKRRLTETAKVATAGGFAFLLLANLAMAPAGAVGIDEQSAINVAPEFKQIDESKLQRLTAADYTDDVLIEEEVSASVPPEVIAAEKKAAEEAKIAAERKAQEKAEAEERARQEASRTVQPEISADPAPEQNRGEVPAGAGAAGIVNAAMAQLGQYQDCTALVERSLRAVGIPAGDLGTKVHEYTALGGKVVTNGYAAGDILVWEDQHVAVYAGNGQIVHGGWSGNQTVVNGHFSPNDHPVVVRFF